VGFTPVRSLDLYRDPDPFRMPAPSEFTSLADVAEFAVLLTAGFGEPLAYSMRIAKLLKARRPTSTSSMTTSASVPDHAAAPAGMADPRDAASPHSPFDRSLRLITSNAMKRFATRRWFGSCRIRCAS